MPKVRRGEASVELKAEVVHQNRDAILVRVRGGEPIWAPHSVIKVINQGAVAMDLWFAQLKGVAA